MPGLWVRDRSITCGSFGKCLRFPVTKKESFRKPTFNSLYDPFGSPYRGQKPSLPLRKAPPLISVFFNGLYTPFGSPVSGGQKPQARRGNRTLLACSVPLRSKVGGASEPSPDFCGMGPPGCLLAWCLLKDFCGNVWRFRNKSVNWQLFKRLK